MRKRLTQILDFYATAITEEFDRSRGYKILSLTLNLVTAVGLFVSTQVQFLWSWKVWVALLATSLLLSIFVAVYRYHMRTVAELNAGHKAEVDKLNEGYEREKSAITSALETQHKTAIFELQTQHESEAEGLRSHINSLYEKYRGKMRAHRERHKAEMSQQRHASLAKQAEKDAEMERLKAEHGKEVASLQAQLDEFKPKLIFEVDSCPQCRASLSHEKSTFAPPEGEPKEVDHYVVQAHVKIHFENHSAKQLMLRKRMEVSLVRRTGKGKEKTIPPQQTNLLVAGEGSAVMPKLEELRFDPITKTKPYMFYLGLAIPTRYGKRLNRNCFLRLTMEAMRQPPCYVDLDVDWEDAKTERGSAMTPKTSAQCQAHRWTE